MSNCFHFDIGLALFLHEKNIPVSVVNPLQVKHFAKAIASKTKTDAKDAQLLSLFGEKCSDLLQPFQPPPLFVQELKSLRTILIQHKKQHTAFKNNLHAFKHRPNVDPVALQSLQNTLQFLKTQIKTLENQIYTIITQHCKEMYQNILTINGIGKTAAAELIIIFTLFQPFQNAKQCAAYIGLNPKTHQSGTSVKQKATLSKAGAKNTRTVLYLASLSAVKYNQSCKELNQRMLANGKSNKESLTAVAHKLLRQAFAIAKSNKPFSNFYPQKLVA